jgi:hypothetical protein
MPTRNKLTVAKFPPDRPTQRRATLTAEINNYSPPRKKDSAGDCGGLGGPAAPIPKIGRRKLGRS